MKYAVALFLFGAALRAQTIPIAIGPNPYLSIPAVDAHGLNAVVSSSVSPDGTVSNASDLYLLDTSGTPPRKLTGLPNNGATWIDLSPDGSRAAYNVTASTPPGMEEIHVVDISSGADVKVAVDTVGCIQPLALCFGCFFSCVRSVHLSPDASKVVYSASETQPLYVVNADGSGVVHLPIQGAALAPSPQRVVSRNGLLVFTRGQDVYTVNLDGSGMQNLTNFPQNVFAANATISEDGGSVAFEMTSGALHGIYVLNPGGAPQQISNSGRAGGPSISADGSQVAFIDGTQAFIQPAGQATHFKLLTATSVALSGDGSTALVSVGSAIYRVTTGVKAEKLYAPPAILPNGISSFSGQSAPSAGSLFRISGWNFQDDTEAFAADVPLPTTLGAVSVTVNGQQVPLLAVTPTQITAQLLFTEPAGDAKFGISIGGDFVAGKQIGATAQVKDTAPEVLQYVLPAFTSNYAMAFHAGTNIPADQGHPASIGEVLEMYGIGLGAVSPTVDAGIPAPSDPPDHAIAPPQVKIGGQNATVTFAGLAPGQIGIYQVNAVVPRGLRTGSQPVSWSNNGSAWTIWVQ